MPKSQVHLVSNWAFLLHGPVHFVLDMINISAPRKGRRRLLPVQPKESAPSFIRLLSVQPRTPSPAPPRGFCVNILFEYFMWTLCENIYPVLARPLPCAAPGSAGPVENTQCPPGSAIPVIATSKKVMSNSSRISIFYVYTLMIFYHNRRYSNIFTC